MTKRRQQHGADFIEDLKYFWEEIERKSVEQAAQSAQRKMIIELSLQPDEAAKCIESSCIYSINQNSSTSNDATSTPHLIKCNPFWEESIDRENESTSMNHAVRTIGVVDGHNILSSEGISSEFVSGESNKLDNSEVEHLFGMEHNLLKSSLCQGRQFKFLLSLENNAFSEESFTSCYNKIHKNLEILLQRENS